MIKKPTLNDIDQISEHDRQVLDRVFNPEGVPFNPEAAATAKEGSYTDNIPAELLSKLKQMEVEAVKFAENGNLDEAIKKLSEILDENPQYSSAYNNRAQARRLTQDTSGALEDLEKAIETANGDSSVLKQAYTQRAIIKKAKGDQEGARLDFEKGAHYGNTIARDAAVRENPYAKLCNAMVMEAMKNLYQQPSEEK
ncbi:hypothetical protein K493DRAFT_286762 [Basidiobolus meristosporus CBS 931.73]|uniref:Uncharacterized protein n=1 Tax=Basidiobolus meristosporus CBS 931.73 TaxID=1314790 RepID=A0A1Y1Y0E8_9FUNG|nr:hypothetical protein K493DRAFT_286762 [Basidiobolus meristosporus CBS 931.73]|eukprot:ORX91480.1 hypothetical protein K493DRAFT_286762 [Basidiobolus meristosporus CBS 931.73]